MKLPQLAGPVLVRASASARTHAGNAGIGPQATSVNWAGPGSCQALQWNLVQCGAPYQLHPAHALMMVDCCDPGLNEACIGGQCVVNGGAAADGGS